MELLHRKCVNELSTYKKRVDILIDSSIRNTTTISSAATFQDKLRKKIKNWNGAKEIEQWRHKVM